MGYLLKGRGGWLTGLRKQKRRNGPLEEGQKPYAEGEEAPHHCHSLSPERNARRGGPLGTPEATPITLGGGGGRTMPPGRDPEGEGSEEQSEWGEPEGEIPIPSEENPAR